MSFCEGLELLMHTSILGFLPKNEPIILNIAHILNLHLSIQWHLLLLLDTFLLLAGLASCALCGCFLLLCSLFLRVLAIIDGRLSGGSRIYFLL